MATNIDERIVAAKFDASDFEKGVDKTIKKLDELKKSLDLKEATKGVKELAEKTEASTDSMSKSLDKLTERFTTFFGMIKQKILSGLADEVAGVFLRMEQSVTGFIRSISSDQVRVGMQKYEQMLTSVRIMMSAGESQDAAYESIGKLREYSDQTSYSLSQMTDALSKMRAAGVHLDTATRSVEGIANACAAAGINANDAQRAFYNLAQAYAKGTLNYTDYKSLELLNMTTEKFKEDMLEAAVEAKTLKKVSDGVYQTINTTDKKVKAGKKVTVKNLNDMLKYDFMNNEAMNKLFGEKFYFDEQEFKKYKKKWTNANGEVDREKAIEEAKKDFGEIAVDAYLAAREARSFTDVINTLKDVVSTGWGTTFEYLFGKLEEAKDFFTELAEGELADVVYKIGEYRNAILGFWDDGVGDPGGGMVFRQTILNISDALGILLKTIMSVLPGFEELNYDEEESTPVLQDLGAKLFMLSMRIRDFSERVKEGAKNFREFMNSPVMTGGPTRIELIRETLTNLANVFGIIAKVVGIAFNAISRAFYTLSPIFDGFLILMSKVTEPLQTLNNESKVFDDIKHSVDNVLTALDPVAKVLGTIIGFLADVAAFFAQMAIDTVTSNISFFADAFGLLIELITGNSAQMKDGEGVLDRIKQDFEGIKAACETGLSAVKEFFGALLGDIRNLLGLTDEVEKNNENQNGGIFSGLIEFFNTNQFVQDAKKWVNQAIVDVGNFVKSIPERVMKFGGNIYDTLRGLFFKDETKYNGSQLETKTVLTPLGEWVDQAIKDIKEFVVSIPKRIIDGVGTITNWIDEVFHYWFDEQKPQNSSITTYKKNENGQWAEAETIFAPRFEQFIYNARLSISKWFDDLPNKIRNAFSNVGSFVTKLYNALDEFLLGKKVRQTISVANGKGGYTIKDVTVRYKQGFSKWLDGVIKEIKKFLGNIPEYIKQGIRGAGDIISSIVGALFGKTDNTEVTSKDVEQRLEKPFEGINLSNILNTIREIGTEILNQIARIFTGSDDVESNMNWFSEQIAKGINWIREKAEIALNWVLEFLGNLPTTISSIFTGEGKDAKEQKKGPIGQAISGFGESIGKFISNIPNTILTLVDNAVIEFGKIWNKIYDALVGTSGKKVIDLQKDTRGSMVNGIHGALEAPLDDVGDKEPTAWEKFVEHLGKTISNIWKELPVWIAKGIDIAIKEIDDLINNISTWLEGIGVKEEVEEASGEIVEQTFDGAVDATEKTKTEEEPALVKAIKGIGERIKTLLLETLPKFIQDAFLALGRLGSTIFSNISDAFSGDIPEDQEDQSTANIGTQVIQFFKEKLPAWFQQAWKDISGMATEIFTGFSTIFTGKKPEGEIQKAANEFGTTIYNIITVTIPTFIKNAFNWIRNLFSKNKKESLGDLQKQAAGNIVNGIHGAVETPLENANDKLEDDVEKPGFWSFIDTIKESLLNAFSSIGPAILNGLATALGWLNKIGEFIIDVISGKTTIGKELEKAYGKEKPELVESLNRVGENLKTFFIETLPKFIGAAISSLIKNADTWFGNLFGAMGDSAEEHEQEFIDGLSDSNKGGGAGHSFDVPIQNAMNIMDILQTIFDSIMNWVGENKTILEVAAIIIALTMLFSKLSDLFGLADEFEEGARAIKWTAITLAIVAIAGIMSYINQLVNSGDKDKITAFESIIDKLAGLFEKIAWIAGLLTAGKLFDALGNKWDNSSKPAVDIVGKLSDGIGAFFKAFGVGAGTYVAGGFINATIDTTFSTISSAFTDLASSVDDILTIIDPFVDQLSEMDDKLNKAISAVYKICDLFAAFTKAIGDLYSNATGGEVYETNASNALATWGAKNANGERVAVGVNKEITSLTAYMNEFEKLEQTITLFLNLSSFLNNLSSALDKFDNKVDLKDKMEEVRSLISSGVLTNFMVDVLNMLKTSIEASHLSSELLGNQFTNKTTGMVMAMDILADTFSILSEGISNLNEENITAIDDLFDVFARLGESFDTKGELVGKNPLLKAFTGDTSLSKIGNEIKLFGIDMKKFYDKVSEIPGFDESSSEETNRKIDSIIVIAKGMAEVASIIGTYGSSAELIEGLGEKLPGFADGIAQMFVRINEALPESLTVERASILFDAVHATAEMLSSLNELSHMLLTYNNIDVSTILDKVFTGMSGDINASKMAAMIRVFDESIARVMAEPDFGKSYETIGSNIATHLISGIQSAIDNDPELRITPILNLDTAEAQLKSLFGIDDMKNIDFNGLAQSAIGANSYTDADRVRASELNTKIDEVTGAINNLKDAQTTVDQLTSAFSQLKMYINKNVLVGEITDDIDYRIGLKIDLVNNNVTT